MASSTPMLGFFKERRRSAVRGRPFPPAWEAILAENVPYFGKLSPDDQDEIRGLVQIFLDEKRFEGAGGLDIDDEIRVTIAAQACVLLLNRESDVYPDLEIVLVYPSTYVDNRPRTVEGGIVVEDGETRLGESWGRGIVVLAWDAVLRGAADVRDGHNVVLHEFAHQLDTEDGSADGAPVLPRRAAYGPWARVLGAAYDGLLRDVASGDRTVIDSYGATNPAEFFAVVTEVFFERPRALRAKHPALYEQMRAFYQQDPAELGHPSR
ncbi:M90 family metallopeptidase [Polyangium sp. 6x1]|uniref:M90 family metallopeptidase n=1 Tax=Polyangium sp. 6x1 TaxID=3042689 RepID=UPI00248245F0|nr:M90 family metallopeptidase [Polyangium sp. 6x1]MDI1445534.1 zinc-dependent peptidase [Polyangium sp. 6x1]